MLKRIVKLLSLLYFVWCSLVFLITMLLVLPFILFCTLVFRNKEAQDYAFVFIRIWAWLFCALCFFSCEVRGASTGGMNQPYIYVSNHTSFLDAVMLVRCLPQSFKPLGKIELAKAPIFGIIYRKVVVMIDRSSKVSRDNSVKSLKNEIAKGQSILIFPEGTMNRTASPLTEFYDGAFRIAIETQTPVNPVVLLNGGNLLPRSKPYLHIRPGTVTAVFADPVAVQGLSIDDIPMLKKQVYEKMKELLIAHR